MLQDNRKVPHVLERETARPKARRFFVTLDESGRDAAEEIFVIAEAKNEGVQLEE